MAEDNTTNFMERLADDNNEILGMSPLYVVLICVALLAICFCFMSMMGTMTMRGGGMGYGGMGYGGYGGYGGGYW